MVRRPASLILSLLLLPAVAAAWTSSRDLPRGPARVTAAALGDGVTRVTVDVPGVELTPVRAEGRDYVRVSLPGAWPRLVAGAPELPRLAVPLRLPDTGDPAVRVVDATWRELATAPVLPSRGNLPRDVDPRTVARVRGPAYAGGVHPARLAELGRPHLARDQRGVGLLLHPVRWDADRGRLLVLERAVLEVVTRGTGGVNPRRDAAPDPVFRALHGARYVDAAPGEKYLEVDTGGRVLIVVPDRFAPLVAPFAQWKRERGLRVEVATVASFGGTAAGIAAGVAARYAAPEGLTYLLLVGDVEDVPTFAGAYEGADDDTRYAQVAGDDLYPDLFVSRISARDEDELLVQLEKFVAYERDPEPGGAWYAHALGVASILGAPTDAERADALREKLLAAGFDAVDRLYEPAATGDLLAAALDEGRSLLNYLGHGSGVSWSNPAFLIEDVQALANGRRQPWIVDVSCANGRFSSPECFAEAWLRAGTPARPHGAVAMYSASTTTPWVPPTLMQEEVVELLTSGRAREIGALYQHGIMKVLDAYPGDIGRQLVEQYNTFGDCTLRVRTRPPRPLVVTHSGSLAAGVPVFPVRVDTAGATVTLTAPGELLGAASTDAEGRADVVLTAPPAAGDEIVLTVTGPDLLPHREVLTVTTPLEVSASPATLPVGATTTVRVTTATPVGIDGEVEVAVRGWGVTAQPRLIAPGGTVDIAVAPAYGETLSLWVREAATGRALHHGRLLVAGATPLTAPGIAAAVPAIGMDGSLAPGTAGELRGWAGESGILLGARTAAGDTVVAAAGDTARLNVVPEREGWLGAAVLKPGRIVHQARVPVVPGRGTLAGTVVGADGGGVHRARVRITRVGEEEPLLDILSEPNGSWTLPGAQPVGDYRVLVERYGFEAHDEVRALRHGDNHWELALAAAPRVSSSGRLETAAGTPLAGAIDVHRPDTGQHVGSATAGADGAWTTPALPAGTFRAIARSPGFRPATFDLQVGTDAPAVVVRLETVAGRILVVADNLPFGTPHTFPTRLDKHGHTQSFEYTTAPSASAATIWGALLEMGYATDIVPADLVDPAAWPEYDLLVIACGDQPAPLANAALREALRGHVAAGGRLLLEGGELAAAFGRDAAVAAELLHVAARTGDAPREAALRPAAHALTRWPVELLVPPTLSAPGYASSDAVTAGADAVAALQWPDGTAAVVAHDPDPDPRGGQVVLFALDLPRLLPPAREDLLQNAVEWLLAEPAAGGAGLVGRVERADGGPATAAAVRLEPGHRALDVDAAGGFAASDLVPGTYRLLIAGADSAAIVREVELTAGQVLQTGLCKLPATATVAACGDETKAIPDDDPTAASVTATLTAAGPVARVRVRVDLDHTWPDDLAVDLTGPDGRTVRLRHPGDVARADPAGRYDGARPGSPLRSFVGAAAGGTWLLRVSDTVELDAGSLTGWCLEVDHPADAGADPPPPPLAWLGNRPNPFNPATELRFSLPAPAAVEIGVHDVRGRRVRTLRHRAARAGPQAVLWDGRDAAGRDLASGVYLVRIRAGDRTVTGKTLLLR